MQTARSWSTGPALQVQHSHRPARQRAQEAQNQGAGVDWSAPGRVAKTFGQLCRCRRHLLPWPAFQHLWVQELLLLRPANRRLRPHRPAAPAMKLVLFLGRHEQAAQVPAERAKAKNPSESFWSLKFVTELLPTARSNLAGFMRAFVFLNLSGFMQQRRPRPPSCSAGNGGESPGERRG